MKYVFLLLGLYFVGAVGLFVSSKRGQKNPSGPIVMLAVGIVGALVSAILCTT